MSSIAEALQPHAHSHMSCKKRKLDEQALYGTSLTLNQSSGNVPISFVTDNSRANATSKYHSDLPHLDREKVDRKLIISKARKLHQSHELVRRRRFSSSPENLGWQSAKDEKLLEHTGSFKEAKSRLPPDIGACHICYRKPTQKKELGTYADCERCVQRTCWVCIRECLGFRSPPQDYGQSLSCELGWLLQDMNHKFVEPREHRRMICSQCCVEKGADGEVWCLGCLEAEKRG
ncbi:hypothetical protein K3495_g9378 [Podosphaera aphanis]|nr:hypothetical protein K3495_g9378 [Podosphaera aphanis]